MNNLKKFVEKNNVEHGKNLVSEPELYMLKAELNLKLGNELTEYILNYGYLAYESVEFYGINSKQGIKSDMLTQTLYLNKYFPITKNLIAFENLGEGEYILIDFQDEMYRFISEENKMERLNVTLDEYIIKRLEIELKRKV